MNGNNQLSDFVDSSEKVNVSWPIFCSWKSQRSDQKVLMKNKIEFDEELLEILYDNGVGKPGTVKFFIINAFIIFSL